MPWAKDIQLCPGLHEEECEGMGWILALNSALASAGLLSPAEMWGYWRESNKGPGR